MEPLANPRHEHFARAIAAGASATQAYIAAGYSERGAHASAHRLLQNAVVANRVRHLQSTVSASVVERSALTREWVIDHLKFVATRCMSKEEFQPAGANRALELLGRELGMFREQSDHNIIWDGDLNKLTEKQLANLMVSLEQKIGDPEIIAQIEEDARKELDKLEAAQRPIQ